MKKVIIILICVISLFMGFTFFTLNANASSINNNYGYSVNQTINENGYVLKVNEDLPKSTVATLYKNLIPFQYEYNVQAKINGYLYTSLYIMGNDSIGGIIVGMTGNGPNFVISEYDDDGTLHIKNNNIELLNNNYSIGINTYFNYFLNLEKRISGFYTFNPTLTTLSYLSSFTSYETFNIHGSSTYMTSSNLFNFKNMSIDFSSNNIVINFVNFSNEETDYNITGGNVPDEVRYLYFDNQTINFNLYNYLRQNGIFSFIQPDSESNLGFADLINAYANIPINIFKSILDISIFSNFSLTLFTVLASGICILICIKIVRMFKE